MGCGASRDNAEALLVTTERPDEKPAEEDDEGEQESLKVIHDSIVASGPKAAALGPPDVVSEEQCTLLSDLPECLCDLHDGMPPAIQQTPLRLLRIKALLTWQRLKVHEEVDTATECLQVPYVDTDDDIWKRVVTVSWRWAEQKPTVYQKDFSPMADSQFAELTTLLRKAEEHGLEFVWIDWSCVPQYNEDSMVEVHRSKVFYARSRAMRVLPTFRPLPAEGPVRLILVKARKVLSKRAESGSVRCAVAAAIVAAILAKNMVAGREYFGRVWTLAERMARYGRGEGLCQWLSLESWLGMVVDAMLKSTEDKASSMIYKKMLGQKAAGLLEAVLDPLAAAVRTGSVQAKACEGLETRVAELCQVAVSVWLSPSLLAEAPTGRWLHKYLGEEARSGVYQAWSEADRVWAVYSYFCWKPNLDQRSADGLRTALEDLVEVAAGDRAVYIAGMFAQLGTDANASVVSPVVSAGLSLTVSAGSEALAAPGSQSATPKKSHEGLSSARRRQEEEIAAATERRRQEEEITAAAGRRRQEEEAALAATERRRHEEVAATAAATERRRQEESAAAAATERRKQEEAAAAAAMAARKTQEEAAAAAMADRRRQEEAAAAAVAERKKAEAAEEVAKAAAAKTAAAATAATTAAPGQPTTMKAGARVVVKSVSVDEAKMAQTGHGGWGDAMASMLGKPGIIASVDKDGNCEVKMDDGSGARLWNPTLLIAIGVGTKVGIKNVTVDAAKAAQTGHGGWVDAMAKMLGKIGTVDSVDSGGNLRVKMESDGDTKLWSPVLVVLPHMASGITAGAKVVIKLVTVDEGKSTQAVRCGWANEMEAMLGKTGTVESVDKDGDCKVKMDVGGGCKFWNSSLLSLLNASGVPTFTVGEKVTIKDVPLDEAKEAQRSHGNWVGDMEKMLGKPGVVEVIDHNRDVKIKVTEGGSSSCYLWNPALVLPGGAGMARSSPVAAPAAAPPNGIQVNTRVVIKGVPVDEAKQAQTGHGGWADAMAGLLGQPGVVTSVDKDGDCQVKVASGDAKLWNPSLLVPMVAGAKVMIKNVSVDEAKSAMAGHGGWVDTMKDMLGKPGVVESVDKDGDIKVKMDDGKGAFLWNPNLVVLPVSSSGGGGGSGAAGSMEVGSKVRIKAVTADEAKAAQDGHGGWSGGMAAGLGKTGIVTFKWADGDVKVKLDDGSGEYCWSKDLVVLAGEASAGGACSPGAHIGEWRSSSSRFWCSTASMTEGKLCTHPGGIIKAPHWSCCGSTAP